jgi:hypothetical protein
VSIDIGAECSAKKEIDNDGHDAPELIDSKDMTRVENDSQQEAETKRS